MTVEEAVAHLEVIADEEDRFVDKVDRSAIQALLTAYAAQAADSQRLDALESRQMGVSVCRDEPPIWFCQVNGTPVLGYRTRHHNLRDAIDAAVSGTETTAP